MLLPERVLEPVRQKEMLPGESELGGGVTGLPPVEDLSRRDPPVAICVAHRPQRMGGVCRKQVRGSQRLTVQIAASVSYLSGNDIDWKDSVWMGQQGFGRRGSWRLNKVKRPLVDPLQ